MCFSLEQHPLLTMTLVTAIFMKLLCTPVQGRMRVCNYVSTRQIIIVLQQIITCRSRSSNCASKLPLFPGSSAKVRVIFTGDQAETEPRILLDEKRPCLKRAGVDSFIMAVPMPLGMLTHLR